METRTLSTSRLDADSPPLYGIRWAAVLAGLAVGLGMHLLLLLIGAAAGFAVYGTGEHPGSDSISLAAALWNSISLLVATTIGGYVAARASGLRRTADGVLHAVASWGASMLCNALLAGSVAGNTLTGAFGMAATSAGFAVSQNSESSMNALLSRLERGDRVGAIRLLRERFGLTLDQASSITDRAISMFGAAGNNGLAYPNPNDTSPATSATSAWLSLVIVLSLAAGAGGGLIGSRASLKRSRPGHYRAIGSRSPDRGIPTG